MIKLNENLPSDISTFLTPDEEVIKTANDKKWDIYITNKRVFLKAGGFFGKEIVETPYHHISSIEYKKENPIPSMLIGGVCIVFAVISNQLLEAIPIFRTISVLSLLISAILAITGLAVIILALLKSPTLKLHIIGRKPITISSKIEELIRISRTNKNE
ncbi:MAG: PH domain-containing protein [Tenericutes bacterium]|nr:PH domain-containing protein [Mycoplasmatota bacterium]